MRETRTITIDKEGRDKGKTFILTEMPASRLEKWAARVLVAAFSGEVPAAVLEASRVSNAGALATALNHVLAGLDWKTVEPLYDELLDGIVFVPNPTKPNATVQLRPDNVDNFIEEVSTLVRLRMAALELNFAFFSPAGGLFSLLTPSNAPAA